MPDSPLKPSHQELGARFTEFGGWTMPLRYESVVEEHMAVRRHAGMFDVSHLGRLEVSGPGAEGHLLKIFCNDVAAIPPGKAQYTMMLNRDGGVVDDIIVWRTGPEAFIVMPNGVNVDDVAGALAETAGVFVRDLRPETVLLAVQGPAAPDIIENVTGWQPRRFRYETLEWDDHVIGAAGTGYTGEKGGELMVPIDAAGSLWEALIQAGCRPAGLGARDTLRLEMGFPLWGQDLDESTTPLEAGLEWVVDWDHKFVGRRALRRQQKQGIKKAQIAFTMTTNQIPRNGYRLRAEGMEGTVTSGNFSPILEKGIGLGYLSPPPTFHRYSQMKGQPDIGLEVEIRGDWLAVDLVSTPFVDVAR